MPTHRVIKVIHFCYGHRLLNYDGKCKNLHGHNARLEIEIASEALDDLGMVIDFNEVKRIAKGWVDEHLDHKMLLCRDDPLVGVLQAASEPLYLMDGNPTAENIAGLLYRKLRELGLAVSRVTVWETVSGAAGYAED